MASRSTGIGLPAMVALVAFGCGGRATPAPTPLGGVAAVTAGGAHACALLTGGTARCWGDDAFGELGDGGYLSPEASVTVGLSGITAIAAGGHHTCALLGDGGISCFGNNSFGALGNGQQTLYELTPASVLAWPPPPPSPRPGLRSATSRPTRSTAARSCPTARPLAGETTATRPWATTAAPST